MFRLSDYDTHTTAPAPTQPSQYPSDIVFNWYSELELEYADQLEAEGYGDAAASYWLNGELAKADIFVVTDVFDVIPSGYTSTYYYHGTTPYLAHIVGYGKEENLDVWIECQIRQNSKITTEELSDGKRGLLKFRFFLHPEIFYKKE